MKPKEEKSTVVTGTDEPTIIIEDGIKIEDFHKNGIVKEDPYYRALDKLEDGQSFSYPSIKHNLISYSIAELQKNGSKHFATRKISGTHRRVWRKA